MEISSSSVLILLFKSASSAFNLSATVIGCGASLTLFALFNFRAELVDSGVVAVLEVNSCKVALVVVARCRATRLLL